MRTLNKTTDEQLVAEALAGDDNAFEELVVRYEKKMYNLAYRITGNEDDASDVLQDTFLQALRKLHTFKGESKFSTWLYRIAANASLMKKRKDKNNTSISLDKEYMSDKGDEIKRQYKDDWAHNPLDILEDKELRDTLYNAIYTLPKEYKVPLILRDIDGLSNEEVTKILNLSLPAVKSRVHRARFFIREKLNEYFETVEGAKK
jgi:RNA polymerase sigma-70 factor (ECF subfamily)